MARGTLVAAAAAVGALGAAGCLLAILFELQGFGGLRDGDPRVGYLLALGFGLSASIVVPLALWRILLPDSSPRTATIASVALAVLVISLLGVVALR